MDHLIDNLHEFLHNVHGYREIYGANGVLSEPHSKHPMLGKELALDPLTPVSIKTVGARLSFMQARSHHLYIYFDDSRSHFKRLTFK